MIPDCIIGTAGRMLAVCVTSPDHASHCSRSFDGLRIVDASVTSSISSGNTNAPIIMIAQRGANMICTA